MNVYLSLGDKELDALEDFWADQIGQGDERLDEMAIKRIEQIRRIRQRPLDYVLENAA